MKEIEEIIYSQKRYLFFSRKIINRAIIRFLYVEMTYHSRSNSNNDEEDQSVQLPSIKEKTKTKQKKKLNRRPLMKNESKLWNYFIVFKNDQHKLKFKFYGKTY